MLFLGFDIGSSFVKGAVIDGETGKPLLSAQYPEKELDMISTQTGWAEQDPEMWWFSVKEIAKSLAARLGKRKNEIAAIGISYQMHGLVLVDKNQQALRPSIIWCDSRATDIGRKAFQDLGQEKCLGHLLNSPGNFTASKMKWVLDHEKSLLEKADKMMLPGDFVALKMTGEARTTISGLSEGMLWDFKQKEAAHFLLDYYGISADYLPPQLTSFEYSGQLTAIAANEMGLAPGIPVTYRAGDQPNNALSLKALEPGELAATAGTSGVIYGISDQVKYDPQSRVNTFAHVNYTPEKPRLGILLCINGTGILNRWVKENTGWTDYESMNTAASAVNVGSDGLYIVPFGNGAERVINDRNIGSSIHGLSFNQHTRAHLVRAAQEGIVFSLFYGMEIMKELAISPTTIRAGHANMFLSPIFSNTLSSLSQVPIELFNTS
ncbi:MAG: FGGY family carbohydrate kinase, partial [Cyclobacteriaceae bacterium]|nr:FGGY family carbohydrate kinase [Cyclobacteriaceae bacterium]